jgi:hypothetical protein
MALAKAAGSAPEAATPTAPDVHSRHTHTHADREITQSGYEQRYARPNALHGGQDIGPQQ